MLPTIRHRYDISSKGAVLPGRNGAEMCVTNSLRLVYTEREREPELELRGKPNDFSSRIAVLIESGFTRENRNPICIKTLSFAHVNYYND